MFYPKKITLSWLNYRALPSMPLLVPPPFALMLALSQRLSFKLIARLSRRQRQRQRRIKNLLPLLVEPKF
jgi:hypothetical protein